MKLIPDPKDYSPNRLFALDILRGADMLLLIAGYKIGTTIGKAYDLGPAFMYQFTHPWIGFTLWDFISPLFLFVVGAAVPLALAKRLTDEGKAGWDYWKHVLVRIAMLWTMGGMVQCGWLSLDPLKMTPYGNTLQTISVGYFFTALVYPIRRAWVRWAIALAGVAVYQSFLCGYGDYTRYGTIVSQADAVIWNVLLSAKNACRETYGLARFTGIPMFFFVCWTGMEATLTLQRTDWSQYRKAGALAAAGAILMLLGFFFWKVLGIPLIKHVFSISITCFTQGICLLLLAGTYVVTDIWKFRRGTGIILLWGQCALFAYFVSHVFGGMYDSVVSSLLRGLPRFISDPRLLKVIHAVASMVVLTYFMAVWRQYRSARRK